MASDTIKVSKWHFSTPDAIFDVEGLDIYAQTIYILLCAHADREGKSFPSYDTLAKRGRMSRRKAIDSVAVLVEKGLLLKEVRYTDKTEIEHTSNEYTRVDAYDYLQTVTTTVTPSAQHALPLVHDMHYPSAQHAPEHNHLSLPELKDRQIESAAAEIAAASAQISSSIESEDPNEPDEIYEALLENVPRFVYVADNIPAGLEIVDEFYSMLQQREFQHMRSPELVRLACELYYERTCRLNGGIVVLKLAIKEPVGMFHTAYIDAYKRWKARRGRSARELLGKQDRGML